MSLQFFAALLAIALGGAAIAVQAPINARLASIIGEPVTAAAISFFVGFLALAALTLVRGEIPSVQTVTTAPWWVWIGGFFGAFYVWAAVWSVGTLGVLTMVAALILGQLVAALALDATGAFGIPVREVSWTRIGAVAMVAGGLILSRL